MSAQSRLAAFIAVVGADVKGLQTSKMNAGYAGLPAGTTITISKTAGVWPARPTTSTSVTVIWRGAEPSPTDMVDGDFRFVTP